MPKMTAADYAAFAHARGTVAGYAADWADFCGWMAETMPGRPPLPAEPGVVAEYLAARAETLRPATLDRHLAAIVHAHREAGHPFDRKAAVLARCRAGIRRVLGTAPQQKRALSVADLQGMVATLPNSLAGIRDRAVLLLTFALGARRAEISGIDVEQITWSSEGMMVRVDKPTKTRQEGDLDLRAVGFGACDATCPVLAVRRWVLAAGLGPTGPLFRAIDMHGNLKGQRLSGEAIALLTKRAVASFARSQGWTRAEVAEMVAATAATSLRAGLVTAAAGAGMHQWEVQAITGHRSTIVTRYFRPSSRDHLSLPSRLGL